MSDIRRGELLVSIVPAEREAERPVVVCVRGKRHGTTSYTHRGIVPAVVASNNGTATSRLGRHSPHNDRTLGPDIHTHVVMNCGESGVNPGGS